MTVSNALVNTFSKEQIDDMRKIVLQRVVFSELARESTKVDNIGDWNAVQCPFHQTNTTDAGRLKDAITTTDSVIEEGVYWCNHPGCTVAQDPYEGRLTLTHFWKLLQGFNLEKEAVVDLYHNRLKIDLPEGDGTPMSEEDKKKYEEEKRMRALFSQITYFYVKCLHEEGGKEALDYVVNERKIPLEYVKRHRLGYTPGRAKLKEYLLSVGFTEDEIRRAKVLSKKGNDLYYERIFFPLMSTRDNVWDQNFSMNNAFILNGYSRLMPKYMNENNTFMKHRYVNRNFPLFNFAEARRKRYGLMIEGCFDTVAAEVFVDKAKTLKAEGSIPKEITLDPDDIGPFASYGTNGFSEEEHAPLLKRAKFDILFIAGDHDANFAGQEANIKRGRMLQKHLTNTQIRIVIWPEKDVNQMLVNELDPVEFLRYLENSVSLEEYEILVALEKSGSSEIVRNQFEAIHRIEGLLMNLNLHEENSILKYKKTLLTLAKFVDVDIETILLHIMMVKYKNDLKKAADDSNLPLKTLLMAELATIISVFGEE